MPTEQLGGLDGHRAVQINGDVWDAPCCSQPTEEVEHGMCPSDSKHRHEQAPTAAHGRVDDLSEVVDRIANRVKPVSVGRLRHHIICWQRGHRSPHHRVDRRHR